LRNCWWCNTENGSRYKEKTENAFHLLEVTGVILALSYFASIAPDISRYIIYITYAKKAKYSKWHLKYMFVFYLPCWLWSKTACYRSSAEKTWQIMLLML
jgi:hypothetical protein